MDGWILTLLTFVPVIGAAIILFIPGEQKSTIRSIALVTTGVCLLLAVWVFANFDRADAGMQFVVKNAWIPSFNI